MLPDILQIIVSIVLLWVTADWIVDSAAAVARTCRVSELAIGLTVVAFGTSAPEFLVTATAAFKGLSDISVANVAGSNLANLGLILGSVAVIKTVHTGRTLLWRDGLFMLGVTAVVAVLAVTGALNRVTGFLLFGSLLGYLGWLFATSRTPATSETGEGPAGHDEYCRKAQWWDYPKLVAGFAGVSLGGNLLVDSARTLAVAVGVSDWVIGLTVVALGTSLPELVTCLAASLRGQNSMLLGNLVGSNIFNLAGVLGVTCLLRPVEPSAAAVENLLWLIAFTAMVLVFIRTGWRVTRTEGALLILANLLLWGRGALG